MFPNANRAKSLSSSQPRPPAPITRTLQRREPRKEHANTNTNTNTHTHTHTHQFTQYGEGGEKEIVCVCAKPLSPCALTCSPPSRRAGSPPRARTLDPRASHPVETTCPTHPTSLSRKNTKDPSRDRVSHTHTHTQMGGSLERREQTRAVLLNRKLAELAFPLATTLAPLLHASPWITHSLNRERTNETPGMPVFAERERDVLSIFALLRRSRRNSSL
mmetsp:Transcript_9176/g.26097  ORF Transcript_9176/g.26097 Transcript_9176/m.26097 type:complete len:218 (-) Transcript_9176:230-883(-)